MRDPEPARENLDALLAGQARFLGGEQRPRGMVGGAEWRRAMEVQDPLAVLLTCADARISPNALFDTEPGRLFVVRVAGPVASSEALGSIEFAVEALGVPLVMVLGHSRCGAVQGAWSLRRAEARGVPPTAPKYLGDLIEQVAVAPEDIDQEGDARPASLKWSEELNARRVAGQLATRSVSLGKQVRAGTLEIVAAHLDLASGKVSLLEDA